MTRVLHHWQRYTWAVRHPSLGWQLRGTLWRRCDFSRPRASGLQRLSLTQAEDFHNVALSEEDDENNIISAPDSLTLFWGRFLYNRSRSGESFQHSEVIVIWDLRSFCFDFDNTPAGDCPVVRWREEASASDGQNGSWLKHFWKRDNCL